MLVAGFVLVIILGSVNADDRPTGYLFYTADVINLDLNQTSYTVGCTLSSTGSYGTDANSHNLTILERGTPCATEIINDTTIIHKVDLQNNDESAVCGVKEYFCKLNRSLVSMRTIHVARPPPLITASDFKCISYNRKRLVCQFPRRNSCGLFTEYHLSMIRLNHHSPCNLTDSQTVLTFDSESKTGVFFSGYTQFSFRIEGKNIIGRTESAHLVDHFNIVKPEQPKNLQNSSLDTTSVSVTWSMSYVLYTMHRTFEVEFHLITKYDVRKSFMNMSLKDTKNKQIMHQLKDLYSFTNYVLKMRVRVVPNAARNFEDEYWSEWSSIEFQTNACKPNEAPRVLPGAYNFKERRDDLATIVVYWEQIPEYLHNGPGFRYDIYALSQSGHRLSTNASNNGVTTFQKVMPDERYTVYLSSYNAEGRSTDVNVIHIYPHRAAYQPKIRRLFRNDSYHLQWFPMDDMEDLSNYTVMYCPYSTTGSCHGSIKLETLPANATSYFLNTQELTIQMTFALAANYRRYSSELTWFVCTVSSTSSISQLRFNLTDVTEHSITVRLDPSCMDRSLIERYEVRYWSKLDHGSMKSQTNRPYETVIPIDDLLEDTNYEVIVTAYDEKGQAFQARRSKRTKSKDNLLLMVLLVFIGLIIMCFISMTAAKRMKKMMNIKVEMPTGLLGIDEKPIQLEVIPERSNNTMELEDLSEVEPIDENEFTSERSSDAVELEELPPSENQPTKSILKKPDESRLPHPERLKQVEKPKSAVRFVTSSDYIKPAQMPSVVAPENPISPIMAETHSSGYVAVNLMLKQQQMVL